MNQVLTSLASVALLLLVAAPAIQATDITGGVANLAPTITSIALSSNSLSPTAGTTTTLTTTIVAADLNGYNDIATVTVTILKPDGSTVHTSGAASFVSGTGTSATYSRALTMNYYDPAATVQLTGYSVKVEVVDAGSPALSVVSTPILNEKFTYAELAALNAPATVDTGSNVQPGQSSSIATMAVSNYGNVRIDMQVSGTAPNNGGTTIPVGSIAYSLASNMASSSALTGSGVTMSSFDLSSGAGSSKNTYWQMTIPSGSSQYVKSGTYTSTLTMTALAG